MSARARNLARTLGFSKKGRHIASPTITQLVADKESSSVAPGDPLPPPCPFCDAILAAFALPLEAYQTKGFKLDLAGLDRDCLHDAWLETASPSSGDWEPQYGKPRKVHAMQGYGRRELVLRVDGLDLGGKKTVPVELVRRHDVDGHLGNVCVLDPAWIDLDVVKSWCTRCPRDHGPKCDVVGIPGTPPIRPRWLIDVEQNCIVPGSSSDLRQAGDVEPHYLALSYTWGLVDDVFRTCRGNLAQVQTPGALLHPEAARRIPATVRDAIALTRELGGRYLWVDSLCIVQDAEQTLHSELWQMHRIYSSAFLTIVAKDGEDASAGLRGIRGLSALPRRSGQIILPLSNGEQLSVVKFTQPKMSSSYDSRMWTFQEELFARRRLVFKHGHVEWECPRAEWREHLDPDIPVKQYVDFSNQGLPGQLHVWMAAGRPSSSGLRQLVFEFNTRVLTNEADCLNAFSGLQTALGHIYTGGLLFGLPEFFFDIYLLWESLDVGRRAPRQVHRTAGGQGSAPPSFMPSWSWMGWHGPVDLPRNLDAYLEPLAEWYAMPGPEAFDQKRRVGSEWRLHHQIARRGDLTPVLKAAGWTRGLRDPMWIFAPSSIWDPRDYAYKSNYPRPTMDGTTTPAVREQCHYLVAEVQVTEYELWLVAARCEERIGRYCFGVDKAFTVIQDTVGNVVGRLDCHGRSKVLDDNITTARLKTKISTVRLVAVVRGWIDGHVYNWICIKASKDGKIPYSSNGDPLKWDGQKKECYYVLCVERGEDGVYSRTGSGWVEAEAWRYAAKEYVEIVLA